MARNETEENADAVDVAKLREEVELLELQIRKIECTVKLRRLRQERPDRRAERTARKKERIEKKL